MKEVEYVYYLYGSKKSGSQDINDAFSFGLASNNGADLDSCMTRIDNPIELKDAILSSKHKCVYVVKIPKMFLEPRVEDGRLKEIPVPMWELGIDGTYFIKSNLIHGVYNKKINAYFPNDFYNEVYNPNGLQFDIQQVEHFQEHNLTKWVKFDEYRKDKPFYSLKNIDRKLVIWKPAVTQYKEYYTKKLVRTLDKSIVF